MARASLLVLLFLSILGVHALGAESADTSPEQRIHNAQQVVKRRPRDVAARVELAWALAAAGRNRQALSVARETRRLAPGNLDVLEVLCATLFEERQLLEAEPVCGEIKRRRPSSISISMVPGPLEAVKRALPAMEWQAKFYPNHPYAHWALGKTLSILEQRERAIAEYQIAIRLAPIDPELHQELAEIYIAQNQPAEALREYEAAVSLKPGNTEYRKAQGYLLAWLNRLTEAVDAYQEVLRLVPNDLDAQSSLAFHLERLWRVPEAEPLRQALVKAQPEDAEVRVMLGCLLLRLYRHEEAVTQLQESLRLNPAQLPAYMCMGTSLAMRGRYAEAEAAFRDGAQRYPEFPDLHSGIAWTLAKRGQTAEAEAELARTRELDRDGYAGFSLGIIYHRLGRRAEAIAALEQALAAIPHEPGLQLTYIDALIAARRYVEARAALDRIIAEQKGPPMSQILVARLLIRKGDYIPAAQYLQTLTTTYPWLAEAPADLAVALAGLKRYDESVVAGRAAVSLQPTSPDAHYGLGFALEQAGRTEDALREYQAALQSDVDHEDALAGLARLRR